MICERVATRFLYFYVYSKNNSNVITKYEVIEVKLIGNKSEVDINNKYNTLISYMYFILQFTISSID